MTNTYLRTIPRGLAAALLLTLTPACGGDDGSSDEVDTTDTATDDTTAADTTTEDESTSDTTTTTTDTTATDTTDTTATDTTDTTATDTTDTTATDTTDTTDSGGALSFETDVYPILMANCSCHVFGAPAQLALPDATMAFANLVGVPSSTDPGLDRVTPSDPDASFLFQKIAGTHAGISAANSQMPKSAGQAMSLNPLSPADQMLISDWITAGAAP